MMFVPVILAPWLLLGSLLLARSSSSPSSFLLSSSSALLLSSSSSSSTTLDDSDNDNGDIKIQSPPIIDKLLGPYSLDIHDFPSTGRGVRTLVDRNPGEILLKIPLEETISSIDGGRSSTTVTSPQTINEEEYQLAMNLLQKQWDGHLYVTSVLPKQHYSIWTIPTQLWEQIVLPRCYQESFQATRMAIHQLTNHITAADATTTTSDADDDADDVNHSSSCSYAYSKEDALWALSMVRSRSIAVPELMVVQQQESTSSTSSSTSSVPIALIPGLDLFNHAFGAGTFIELMASTFPEDNNDDNNNHQPQQQYWTLTSTKSYAAGDQIFLSYGDDDKDNWKLLLTYGFSCSSRSVSDDDDDDNTNAPPVLVFWTWQDLLEAAGQVRPTVFTKPTIRQLIHHPQLYEMYSNPSNESRATFSYNAKTQVARPSLLGGLEMLNNLAVQLGHTAHDTTLLSNDTITQLIQNRCKELTQSIASMEELIILLRQPEGDDDNDLSEWQPFLESILLTLMEEQKYLLATIK